MPTYKYTREHIGIRRTDQVALRMRFPEPGRTATHEVDLPGPSDKKGRDECTIELGDGELLLKERTVALSGVINLSSVMESVAINYYLDFNGVETEEPLVEHTNPVTEDKSPLVKVVLTFTEIQA